ncbi:MAG: hypothetical protein IJL56_08520 [Bacteroidales bacterium]|nr:hypothetical protein [Bacteroidales bacterium]
MSHLRILLFITFSFFCLSISGCKNRHTYNSNDQEQYIHITHNWRDIAQEEYHFDAPRDVEVKKWEGLCEARNAFDSVAKSDLDCFADANQMMTVQDFIQLWYNEESYLEDDDLTTWRLMQYDKELSSYCDSEFDRFSMVKNAIQSLLLYCPMSQMDINYHSALEQNFQEYYDRLLLKEAIRHSEKRLSDALEREQDHWLQYQTALDSSFRSIQGDPNGMGGSAWPMAICGILEDNAIMREISIMDFYFALTDNLDYEFLHKTSRIGEYEVERHAEVKDKDVLDEYKRFMVLIEQSFFDPECHYSKTVMRNALKKEMTAWKGWMSSRKQVSDNLEESCKSVYDNATNNVRRYKLIMLKNRYQGYGLIESSVEECLLDYSCPDEDIEDFSFEKRWRSLYSQKESPS